jgi:hypothetical protein
VDDRIKLRLSIGSDAWSKDRAVGVDEGRKGFGRTPSLPGSLHHPQISPVALKYLSVVVTIQFSFARAGRAIRSKDQTVIRVIPTPTCLPIGFSPGQHPGPVGEEMPRSERAVQRKTIFGISPVPVKKSQNHVTFFGSQKRTIQTPRSSHIAPQIDHRNPTF